jgi:hypothetical protein
MSPFRRSRRLQQLANEQPGGFGRLCSPAAPKVGTTLTDCIAGAVTNAQDGDTIQIRDRATLHPMEAASDPPFRG